MALSQSIEQREYDKFEEVGGKPAVRTTGSFTGTFTDSGLSIGGLLTLVPINQTTWTAIPLTPQPSRNTIAIQNRSGEGMYLSFTGVDLDPVYKGWYIPDNGVEAMKITEDIIVYAKSETSAVKILIKELA